MSWFKKSPRRIYLDYASATPVVPEASVAMREAERFFGNPGGIHAEGVEARRVLQHSREAIAAILGVKSREIIFTSGLTEGNNLAIVGFARNLERVRRTLSGTHWIVSSIEHASVLECFSEIERLGGEVTHLDPNGKGIITADRVATALKPETVFLSVGWANNEIGVIQPLSQIAQAIRAHEEKQGTTVALHADAGQAPLYLGTSVHSLGVDLLSLSASKLYGPHGIGALYISNKVQISPVIVGGDQERGLRSGTENVALASGFAAALKTIAKERDGESKRLQKLRDELGSALQEGIPGLVINGDLKRALPHMLNVSIPDIDSEYLTLRLDHLGIALSTKSACNEGNKESHVVASLAEACQRAPSAHVPKVPFGASPERARNTLRFSLGRATSEQDIRTAISLIAQC